MPVVPSCPLRNVVLGFSISLVLFQCPKLFILHNLFPSHCLLSIPTIRIVDQVLTKYSILQSCLPWVWVSTFYCTCSLWWEYSSYVSPVLVGQQWLTCEQDFLVWHLGPLQISSQLTCKLYLQFPFLYEWNVYDHCLAHSMYQVIGSFSYRGFVRYQLEK